MTPNTLPRSRIRARNQNRYVFSLTNSKRQTQHRPKLSQKLNDDDLNFLTNPKNGHASEVRAKRSRRNTKLTVAIVSGMMLVFMMDGILYKETEPIDLFSSELKGDTPIEPLRKKFEMKQYTQLQPQLRGGGGHNSFEYNRAFGKIEGAAYQENSPPIKFSRKEAVMHIPPPSNFYDSIVNDVAALVTGSKKLDDMKLVISFDGDPNSLKRKASSGLRSSPGALLPNQELRLERNRKFNPSKHMLSRLKTAPHKIAGLQCALYGGPNSDLETRDIVYWQDIKTDNDYISPFFYEDNDMADDENIRFKMGRDSHTKYITFEPNPGGFNNNRIAFENFLTLSAAMGRTLVIPPKLRIQLLDKGTEKQQYFSMDDFFHLDSLNNENVGVNVITMEEFLRREGVRGHFTRYASDETMFPPHNQTNWDYGQGAPINELWSYLRTVGYKADEWNNDCVGAFPSDAGGNNDLLNMMNVILYERDGRAFPDPLDFQGRPVPPQAPPMERLREILAGRRRLCLYTDEMQKSPLVHFPSDDQNKLFMQFYSFAFFEDFKQAAWTLRFVRDHLRYKDVIMCAAVRIIKEIEKNSLSRSNILGSYTSIHLRRVGGSFRENYRDSSLFGGVMNSLQAIEANSTIFVSTDESLDDDIFKMLRQKYNVLFLQDFQPLLEGINPNFYGMIEQLIAARAESFYGTYYSTFSGYICRLRGYYAAHDKKDGYNEGKLLNTFYINDSRRREYGIAKAVQRPFFAREYPLAWRNIDIGTAEKPKWFG